MNFEKAEEEKYTVVTSNVEKLDSTNAPELKAELVFINKKSINNIIIDMSKTKYCDSSGLSSILVANRLCKNASGTFVLCALQPAVEKLIQISQLHTVLNITPTLDEAVDLLYMDEVERELSKGE